MRVTSQDPKVPGLLCLGLSASRRRDGLQKKTRNSGLGSKSAYRGRSCILGCIGPCGGIRISTKGFKRVGRRLRGGSLAMGFLVPLKVGFCGGDRKFEPMGVGVGVWDKIFVWERGLK